MAGAKVGRAALVSITALCMGCFLGIDSTWFQNRQTQSNIAASGTSKFASDGPSVKITNTFKVRVYATPKYVAENIEWQKQTKEIVEDASDVLAGAIGVKLAIQSQSAWSEDSTDLDATLTALEAKDPATEGEWVVGMIGGLPKFSAQFHFNGKAVIFGRHLVMRPWFDPSERDDVEKGLDSVSAEERARFLRDRRRHLEVSLFLHELGHTLGAVHDSTLHGLMNDAVSTNTTTYGPSVTELLRVAVVHRGKPQTKDLWPKVKEDLLRVYKGANPSSWFVEQRKDMLEMLESSTFVPHSYAAMSMSVTSASASTKSDEVAPLLKEKDRPTYLRAKELFAGGNAKEAWELAQPLFDAYPDVLGVQDLRCQLAMKQGFEWKRTKLECDRLMKLSTEKK